MARCQGRITRKLISVAECPGGAGGVVVFEGCRSQQIEQRFGRREVERVIDVTAAQAQAGGELIGQAKLVGVLVPPAEAGAVRRAEQLALSKFFDTVAESMTGAVVGALEFDGDLQLWKRCQRQRRAIDRRKLQQPRIGQQSAIGFDMAAPALGAV